MSIGWIAIQALRSDPPPGQVAVLAGDRAFADANYDRALKNYREALKADPDHIEALRGKARSLLQKERYDEAVMHFDIAIEREPEFPGTYANRGIALDRMGEYELALKDYEYALHLNPSVADGPGWITRLLHMDAAGPPTVEDRANYLRQQLALPEEERVLRVADEEGAARTYRQRWSGER